MTAVERRLSRDAALRAHEVAAAVACATDVAMLLDVPLQLEGMPNGSAELVATVL